MSALEELQKDLSLVREKVANAIGNDLPVDTYVDSSAGEINIRVEERDYRPRDRFLRAYFHSISADTIESVGLDNAINKMVDYIKEDWKTPSPHVKRAVE